MSLSFFRDKLFFRELLTLAVPVAFQQLITAGLNMVDVVMVGQLGESSVAALGLANQIFFILILFLFGVSSGMSIFSAQYWGKRDIENIRRVLGMCLVIAVGVAAVFSLAATLIPEKLMSFYTEDPEVIRLGSDYLRIAGLSYVFMGISLSFIFILRSITYVTMTMIVSVVSLALKTAIGYTLIFGYYGFPALGVRGAAIGTTVGWVFECFLLLLLVYLLKTPIAAYPSEYFKFDRVFVTRVLRTVTPAVINEGVWSIGITTYNAVYARIGTDSIAAININATIEELTFVLFIGMANACSVMVGNKIGENENDIAFEYGRRFTILVVMLGILSSIGVYFARDTVVNMYSLSATAAFNLRNIMLVYSLSAWLRAFNLILFIGALRAGGDTKFAMFMELFSIWLIGVPAALIGGFVLHLPVYFVYALVLLEEVAKAGVTLWRFLSRRWIHDLVNLSGGEAALPSKP